MSDARTHPVGLITVTYSPGDTLTTMLDSIGAATDREVAIVISDNGSRDGSIERVEQRPGVQVVRNPGNLGFGRGVNVAMQALPADADPVLVVNPDVTFGPGAIDALIQGLARHPEAGVVGPLITTPDGRIYPSARQLPSIGTGVGHAVFGWFWPDNPWTRAYRRDHADPIERQAGWLSGSCLLIRRKAFEEVGGFDPAFFMYFEDVDLGDRMARAGWRSIYLPDASVVHIGGHATAQHRPEMTRVHHLSAYRYLARRYSRWWQAPLRLAIRCALFLRGVVAGRSGRVAGGAALPDNRPGGS